MTARGSRSTKMQRAAGKSSRSSQNTNAFDGVFSLRYGAPCRSASGSNRSSINCAVSRSTSGAEAKASIAPRSMPCRSRLRSSTIRSRFRNSGDPRISG